MHDQIRSHFAAIESALAATTIPQPRQQAISDLIGKLPPLYTQYRETNSSRFGDDITRIVQTLLREMGTCPEATKLEADFREGLHRLHEDLGIPKLPLKAPKAPPAAKSRKTTKS